MEGNKLKVVLHTANAVILLRQSAGKLFDYDYVNKARPPTTLICDDDLIRSRWLLQTMYRLTPRFTFRSFKCCP